MVKRVRLPYVVAKKAKGKTYYYFEWNGHRHRLPDNPDSAEFSTEYWHIRNGGKRVSKTTFNALIASYYRTPRFQSLAKSTQTEYKRTLELIRQKNGDADFTRLRRRDVIAARDAYAETWRKANAMVEMLSVLARHARDLEWITHNPAQGVEKLKGGEYQPWPAWALRAYENAATGHALTAYHLCVGTGQRIGDVCKMEWYHFDGKFMSVVQEKTGARLWIACPPKLLAYLDSLPKSGRFILAKNLARPIGKRQVQEAVMRVRREIGATAFVIHGWRYTAAVELAELGCSDSEIAAVTGHKTLGMVQKYRAQANQKRLSKKAQGRRK